MTSYQAQLRHCVEQEVPGRLPAVRRGGREIRFGGHGNVWQDHMEKAAKEADELGRNRLAELLPKRCRLPGSGSK